MSKKPYKIAIIGAGFAGGILAKQLMKNTNAEVVIFDKCNDMQASESGTGLNINPNGMMSLKMLDPALESALRKHVKDKQYEQKKSLEKSCITSISLSQMPKTTWQKMRD